MTGHKGCDLELQLAEAEKALLYYKRLAQESGNRRLRETEELSNLVQRLKQAESEVAAQNEALLEANRSLKQEVREREQAQEALRESERALFEAKKMEAIADLAGGVAHDFNNALMTLTGRLELLKLDMPEQQTFQHHTDSMMTSIQEMVRLTEQLLAYARGGKYHPVLISLGEFLENTVSIIKSMIHPGVRLEKVVADDLHKIKADPTQMQMIISALVSNSSEAIVDTGKIVITFQNDYITADMADVFPGLTPGAYVSLVVQDDGEGMDRRTLKRIFDPFFTTKFYGRGLGMAAVYGIVKNHDGWITVDSKCGKGTVVRIYLPAAEN